jgi:hypothetical protein
VQVGGFVSCEIENEVEHIVLVEHILRREGGDITVQVRGFFDSGTNTARGLPIYTASGRKYDIEFECILQPVHMYPACSPSSICTVTPLCPIPHSFNVPCTALNGIHDHTESFVRNIYLVK